MTGGDYDRFGDYINDEQGIFSPGTGAVGDGLSKFDGLVFTVRGPGNGLLAHVLVEMACRRCGQPRQVMVEWPEIVAIRVGISPFEAFRSVPSLSRFASNWRVTDLPGEVYWYPEEVRCGCGGFLQPLFTPRECAKHLVDMARKNWLNQQDEKQVGNMCFAALQRR